MLTHLTRAMPYLKRVRMWLFVAVCFLFISPFLLSCMQSFDAFQIVNAAINSIKSIYHVHAEQINIVDVSRTNSETTPDNIAFEGWSIDYTVKGIPGEHHIKVQAANGRFAAVDNN